MSKIKISPKSQIETNKIILEFLGNISVSNKNDLLALKNSILNSLKFYPYNSKTKKQADKIQWTRTASEIIADGYVYKGKACSDITVVFLALCKAAGRQGRLVKLKSIDNQKTHSIAEVRFNDGWYRLDVSSKDSLPVKGALTKKSVWNKEYRVFKKGRDVWDLGLRSKNEEDIIFND